MRAVRDACILLILLLFGFSALALAEIEKGPSKTTKLDAKPIDVAVSADGKYTFILAAGGKILIFDSGGELKDTLQVSDSVDSIGTSPSGDFLMLADSKADTLEFLKISFIVDIDISSLPFKGTADAPVVIAVFSDYQ